MKPQTEQALLERAQQIAGLTLGELAGITSSCSAQFKTRQKVGSAH